MNVSLEQEARSGLAVFWAGVPEGIHQKVGTGITRPQNYCKICQGEESGRQCTDPPAVQLWQLLQRDLQRNHVSEPVMQQRIPGDAWNLQEESLQLINVSPETNI